MAIIAHLSDTKLSYNSVEMTQKSCFLMVAQPVSVSVKILVELAIEYINQRMREAK